MPELTSDGERRLAELWAHFGADLRAQVADGKPMMVAFADMLLKAHVAICRAMPYSDYLKTEAWEMRRAQTIRLAKYACQQCTAKETELHAHHLTYERRGAEWVEDLIALCLDCHEEKHPHMAKDPQAQLVGAAVHGLKPRGTKKLRTPEDLLDSPSPFDQ